MMAEDGFSKNTFSLPADYDFLSSSTVPFPFVESVW